MEVSKFRKAMRPKKYLTRDFVVYQDPKRLEARSEMQAGGVVEREGKFRGIREGGPLPKGYGTVKEFFELYGHWYYFTGIPSRERKNWIEQYRKEGV